MIETEISHGLTWFGWFIIFSLVVGYLGCGLVMAALSIRQGSYWAFERLR